MRAWHRRQRAPISGSARATAAAEDARHWNADDQGTSGVTLSTFGGFERCELDRASAAHPKCCCALCNAGTPLERRQRRLILFFSFRKEECCSMRVHLDRKRLDGDAIAFVVITLLIVIAFAY
jgi:hypothetical protein